MKCFRGGKGRNHTNVHKYIFTLSSSNDKPMEKAFVKQKMHYNCCVPKRICVHTICCLSLCKWGLDITHVTVLECIPFLLLTVFIRGCQPTSNHSMKIYTVEPFSGAGRGLIFYAKYAVYWLGTSSSASLVITCIYWMVIRYAWGQNFEKNGLTADLYTAVLREFNFA